MPASAVAGVLISLALAASAAVDPDTVVFASFGDWGWSPQGAFNTLLTAPLLASATCKNFNGNATITAACNDGDKNTQAMLILSNRQQVAQIATAKAMAQKCTSAGGCDFLMSLGDNFYDLGINNGTTDPQWDFAFQQVYTKELFGSTPILVTLGNHDYSVLADGSPGKGSSVQAQMDYSKVDPRWVLPGRNYDRTFKSKSGAVAVQVVSLDSTPLHNRYLFSGHSGGGFAKTAAKPSGDTVVNDPGNAVLNPGVNINNGWPAGGPLYNATNFACAYDWTSGLLLPGYAGGSGKNGASGCKYASYELAGFASPSKRKAAWDGAAAAFTSGFGKAQAQVLMTHFPILSPQQRMYPLYEDAKAMLQVLGEASPQIVFAGHDHIAAHLKGPELKTSFVIIGSGGITDTTTMPPTSGYAQFGDGSGFIETMISKTYNAVQNPDVNYTQFWSAWNGFALTTVNKTSIRVDYYLLNCLNVLLTGACSEQVVGPVNTVYFPARNVTAPAPAPAPAPTPIFANGAIRTGSVAALAALWVTSGY